MPYDPNAEHLKRYKVAFDSELDKWCPVTANHPDGEGEKLTIRGARKRCEKKNAEYKISSS